MTAWSRTALWLLLLAGACVWGLAAVLLPVVVRAVLHGAFWAWVPLGITVIGGLWGVAAVAVAIRRLAPGGRNL